MSVCHVTTINLRGEQVDELPARTVGCLSEASVSLL